MSVCNSGRLLVSLNFFLHFFGTSFVTKDFTCQIKFARICRMQGRTWDLPQGGRFPSGTLPLAKNPNTNPRSSGIWIERKV